MNSERRLPPTPAVRDFVTQGWLEHVAFVDPGTGRAWAATSLRSLLGYTSDASVRLPDYSDAEAQGRVDVTGADGRHHTFAVRTLATTDPAIE